MGSVHKLLENLWCVARVSGTRTALSYARALLVTLPSAVRTRSLAAADSRMTGRWPYRLQGVSLELDGCYFAGAREMYCRHVYFPSDEFAVRPGTTVVDLGSNAGLFSLLAGLRGCRVLSVEAQWGFVREQRALFTEYGVGDRVTTEHALVGASGGLVSDRARLEAASHFEGEYPAAVTMGELFTRHAIEAVDFMKVDVEGSEFAMFRDDLSWLGKVRQLAMEVHPSFGSVSELKAVLARHGFRVELRDESLAPSTEEMATYLHATRVL